MIVILSPDEIYVYSRPNYDLGPLQENPSVTMVEAPLMEISSSIIRKLIKEKKSIRYWVPDQVLEEIEQSGMYL